MRSTSTALKRLGVAAVAAVTLGAGMPLLLSNAASAQQADPRLVVTSDGATTTQNCETFTVTREGANNNASATPTVTITITEVANSGTGDLTFCNTSTGAASGSDTTAGDGRAQLVVVNSDRSFTFGVLANGTVTADVTAASSGFTSGTTRAAFAPASTASPSATPTATMSPSRPPSAGNQPSTPPGCARAAEVVLGRDTIIATGSSPVGAKASPNSVVDLYAYSRPSTTYRLVRSGTTDSNGNVTFTDLKPPTNTRLYAQQRGCAIGQSVVLNVRTQISLNVVRNGTRDYTFSGRLLPARPGGLIASLYRVTTTGQQILTSQTRADASTGQYVINRKFTGSGRFGFVVRTGQDLQNAPGSSNVRSLLVF